MRCRSSFDMLAAVIARVAGTAAVGYLLGSFPTADLVSRAQDVDLRNVGDRNPGWWNARQTLGRRTAVPVLVGDVAKGCLAAAVGRAVARPGQWWMPYVTGGAAMVGHAWPIFAHFRGGRAVATFGGVAAVVSPRCARRGAGRWRRDVRRDSIDRARHPARVHRLPTRPTRPRRRSPNGRHRRVDELRGAALRYELSSMRPPSVGANPQAST